MYGIYLSQGKDKHDIGLRPEESRSVVPEVVGYEEKRVDICGLSYDHLTILLMEAIKKEEKEIEVLMEEVNAQKAENPQNYC